MEELSKKNIAAQSFDFTRYFRLVEKMIKGKSRLRLLQDLEDYPIHIYGESDAGKSWKDIFPNSTFHFHAPVSFHESLKIAQKSKVFLHTAPFFKRASHERVFYALASSCFVLCEETRFFAEEFVPQEGVFFYRPWDKHWMNKSVEKILSQEDEVDEENKEGLMKARKRVLDGHTWKDRARKVLDYISMNLQSK